MNLEEILHKLELIESMLFTLMSEENQEAYFNKRVEERKIELLNAINNYENAGGDISQIED